MNLYLVRHTKYDNPDNIFPFHLPVYLSTDGRKHAKRIGKWFKQNAAPKIKIYSSPIVRALQTAEIIASSTNSFVQIDTLLTETLCEKLQGTKKPKVDAWKVEYDYLVREPIEKVKQRAIKSFKEKASKNKNCILVSHGDPLTILFYYLSKKEMPNDYYHPKYDKDYLKRGEIVKVALSSKEVQTLERIIV